MKDREPVRMPENIAEVEKPEPAQFVREGIESYAWDMARHSIGGFPTPTPRDFATDGSFALFTDKRFVASRALTILPWGSHLATSSG